MPSKGIKTRYRYWYRYIDIRRLRYWHEINGLQVDDTPDSVGWGLGTLLADHDRCRWMGRNGRAAVDAVFSWDNIAEQTERTYCTVA